MGGLQCRLSILRNGKVTLSNLRVECPIGGGGGAGIYLC